MTPMIRLIHLFSGLALSAGSLIAADAPRVVATFGMSCKSPTKLRICFGKKFNKNFPFGFGWTA